MFMIIEESTVNSNIKGDAKLGRYDGYAVFRNSESENFFGK
ncbi:hypothetical protein IG7_05592 [Bacillus cereus HuA2-4]|nr:hypothetical protein IG7_05592 [Bacillus cereus HuA2-4]